MQPKIYRDFIGEAFSHFRQEIKEKLLCLYSVKHFKIDTCRSEDKITCSFLCSH